MIDRDDRENTRKNMNLHISKQICQQLKGDLTIESSGEDGQLQFIIYV